MSKVTVFVHDWKGGEFVTNSFVFDGDYEVAVQPDEILIILENVPDLLNKGEGTVKRIKAVFNHYDRVEVD